MQALAEYCHTAYIWHLMQALAEYCQLHIYEHMQAAAEYCHTAYNVWAHAYTCWALSHCICIRAHAYTRWAMSATLFKYKTLWSSKLREYVQSLGCVVNYSQYIMYSIYVVRVLASTSSMLSPTASIYTSTMPCSLVLYPGITKKAQWTMLLIQ